MGHRQTVLFGTRSGGRDAGTKSQGKELEKNIKHIDVLIIGGGPSGSYAASVLAREGINVAVLESSKFPRYHIGESLIPSIRHYLRFIGAEEKLENYGFIRKPGSAIKFNQFKREGYTDFVALGHNNNAWNVDRSEFDLLLLNHARSSGAAVYEQTKVTSVSFSSDNPTKPVSVSWSHVLPPSPLSPPASPMMTSNPRTPGNVVSTPVEGTTTFGHLIDASGRAGILSTVYLKNRHFTASLKNIAVWGYWTGVGTYGSGTTRHGSPWFEALTDESGWAWFIPLDKGRTSIGIVMNQDMYNARNKSDEPLVSLFALHVAPNPTNSKTTARYLSDLSLAPGLLKLITAQGRMEAGSVKSASDFSYSAPNYAGRSYRIVGDAGAFIDPFFSSGIHLAMTSALSAASTICASIRGDCSEEEAAKWHTNRFSTSYTRFQVVVLSAYKQIRAQSDSVLADIDEDNYDRAFSLLRPVIQGAAEMGSRLSESELQKSLDFCVNLFNPTTPEQHQRLCSDHKIGKELLDVTAPLMDPATLDDCLHHHQSIPFHTDSCNDENDVLDARMILNKVNARKVVHSEYSINNLESEPLGGLVVRLKVGALGLSRAASL
ncbi:FAD/NAD(P)-binding domain-containing protein [Marasmius fiardii PR-910]|nr:FAD/NAD(P)-binding domain-containing protein [Marasmius fiardii PR-910]